NITSMDFDWMCCSPAGLSIYIMNFVSGANDKRICEIQHELKVVQECVGRGKGGQVHEGVLHLMLLLLDTLKILLLLKVLIWPG
ncbi:hypothetical protein VIGAN_03178600, partial [Vigna angularis var. angularis]